MARIEDLPADQRASLQLILKQGRSYDEIAELLRLEPRAVRERARSAVDALGPEDVHDLPLDEQDEIADYLLGQQSASRRAATRELLESSAGARAWARVVAGELRPLAGDDLPEIPAEAAEVDEAFDALQARTERRQEVRRSSRVGGYVLLAGLGAALFAVLALLIGGGDDDDGGSEPVGSGQTQTQAQTGTGTQAAGQPRIIDQINMFPPGRTGGNTRGVVIIAEQQGRRQFILQAQGLQPARRGRYYAVWLYNGPGNSRFMGFPNPQPNRQGRIQSGDALPRDANRFDQLVITRETQRQPRQPGTIVLAASLEGLR
jgi:hypothetical protein